MSDGDRILTVSDVARLARVRPATISTYVRREQMPRPDGQFGRTPWWREATIRRWLAQRARSPRVQSAHRAHHQ